MSRECLNAKVKRRHRWMLRDLTSSKGIPPPRYVKVKLTEKAITEVRDLRSFDGTWVNGEWISRVSSSQRVKVMPPRADADIAAAGVRISHGWRRAPDQLSVVEKVQRLRVLRKLGVAVKRSARAHRGSKSQRQNVQAEASVGDPANRRAGRPSPSPRAAERARSQPGTLAAPVRRLVPSSAGPANAGTQVSLRRRSSGGNFDRGGQLHQQVQPGIRARRPAWLNLGAVQRGADGQLLR